MITTIPHRTLQALPLLLSLVLASCQDVFYPTAEQDSGYSDGRPNTRLLLQATDYGIVLRHGGGPGASDVYGARDVWVFEDGGTYYMHYDAAGSSGWLTALATSEDLIHWTKHGVVLGLGDVQREDAGSASYGVTYRDGSDWHMFYLGTPNVSPAPYRVPIHPYVTMKATANSPAGPWTKQYQVIPFRPVLGTYYSASASPGHVIRHGDEFLHFFSASSSQGGRIARTLGIARTRDLDGAWQIDPEPILPVEEQIENASLYFEPANQTWFLFTNHVAVDRSGREYTDAIWVYWSKDPSRWEAENKALVLNGDHSRWSRRIIGLPSVIPFGDRLAIFYDGLEGNSIPSGVKGHMNRDIGLAWLTLPLQIPR